MWRRALAWFYPALLLAMGVGFQVWSFSQSQAADAYRNAPQCRAVTTSGCYQLLSGHITSVQVSQTRDGERDAVAIQSPSLDTISATLEPSATDAAYVRTGAEVAFKLYRSQVTLVEINGVSVASTANPVATQSDATFTGWLLIATGALSFAVPVYLQRRRKASAQHIATGDVSTSAAQLEPEVVPSGGVGWSVRPQRNLSTLGRYGFVALLTVGMTYRALFDPAREAWAILLDAVVILGMVALVLLFLRNDRVFADRERIGKTNLLGRTVSVPLHQVARADRFSVPNRYGRNRYLVVVAGDGRKAFGVAGPNWDYARLDHLCRAAGVKLSGSYDDTVSAFKLNQRVPGTTNWGGQVLLLAGLVVFIVAFVALLGGPSQR